MNRTVEVTKVDGLEKKKVEKDDGRLMVFYRPEEDGEGN